MELFNRLLTGTPDILQNFKLHQIILPDQAGIEHTYPAAIYTGNPKDQITGKVFPLSNEELIIANLYETQAYTRQLVKLVSGKQTWAYLYDI